MTSLLRNKAVYETILSYVLGLIMFSYGLIKLLRIQFVVPSFIWSEPVKNLEGVTLTWVFLGFSPGYTVLLGFVEAIPAILVLFHKTRLPGALLLFPVLLNVFAINVAFDFLPHMCLLSGMLLLLDMLIISFHYPLLKEVAIRIFTLQRASKRRGVELISNLSILGVLTGCIGYAAIRYTEQRNFLTGDWYNGKLHFWYVTDQRQDETTERESREQKYVRYYFQANNEVYAFLPGTNQPIYKRYQLDEGHHLLTITDPMSPYDTLWGTYRMIDTHTLEWNRENGAKKVYLAKQELK